MLTHLMILGVLFGLLGFSHPSMAASYSTPTTATALSTSAVTKLGAADRTFYQLCIVGDPQTLTNTAGRGSVPDNQTCKQDAARGCTKNCDDSVYCKSSWEQTNLQILRNMAYEMTGQCDKIDWTGTKDVLFAQVGTSPIISGRCLSHPKCDAIIAVGDIGDRGQDYGDGDASSTVPEAFQQEVRNFRDHFVDIAHAAGVPVLVVNGNHDPSVPFSEIFSEAYFSSYPWYMDGDEASHQYQFKVTMGDGKDICLVGTNCSPTAAEITQANGWIGCGASLPTIVVNHMITTHTGTHYGSYVALDDACNDNATANIYNNIVNVAANAEIIMAASGHETSYSPLTTYAALVSPSNYAGGEDILDVYVDFQEANRVNTGGGNTPYGITADDGAGGVYKVVTIDPTNSTVSHFDWAPWFQSRSSPVPTIWTTTNGQITLSPNWATRFP